MERFGITDPEEQHEINKNIIADVRDREEEHRLERERKGKYVLGRKAVVETRVGAQYKPDRKGRKMLVHSLDRKFRKKQIKWIKELIARGREVLKRWRLGAIHEPYPLGLFPPNGVRLAEPIRW